MSARHPAKHAKLETAVAIRLSEARADAASDTSTAGRNHVRTVPMSSFPLSHVSLFDLDRLQVSRQVENAFLERRQVLCSSQNADQRALASPPGSFAARVEVAGGNIRYGEVLERL